MHDALELLDHDVELPHGQSDKPLYAPTFEHPFTPTHWHVVNSTPSRPSKLQIYSIGK
jgi:hypothetical protein